MAKTIGQWNDSLAVRIPQNLAREMNLAVGMEIDCWVIAGNLVIRPKKQKSYSLEELVQKITPENIPAEIDSGRAVGQEAW